MESDYYQLFVNSLAGAVSSSLFLVLTIQGILSMFIVT